MSSLISIPTGRVDLGRGNLAGVVAHSEGANEALLGLDHPGAVHAALVVDAVEDNVGADILNSVGGSSSLIPRTQRENMSVVVGRK